MRLGRAGTLLGCLCYDSVGMCATIAMNILYSMDYFRVEVCSLVVPAIGKPSACSSNLPGEVFWDLGPGGFPKGLTNPIPCAYQYRRTSFLACTAKVWLMFEWVCRRPRLAFHGCDAGGTNTAARACANSIRVLRVFFFPVQPSQVFPQNGEVIRRELYHTTEPFAALDHLISTDSF